MQTDTYKRRLVDLLVILKGIYRAVWQWALRKNDLYQELDRIEFSKYKDYILSHIDSSIEKQPD